MKKKICAALSIAASVALVLCIAMACINAFCFDGSFYAKEYAKLNTSEYVGVSGEELDAATDVLLGYLKDERGSLDLEVSTKNGEQFFNEREKAHMTDVKDLYQGALALMVWGFVLSAAAFCACFLIMKARAALTVLRSLFWSVIGTIAAFGVLGALACADFNTFWTNFHLLFFTNDLWLLNPATDRLIRMYEQTFFFDLVTGIIIVFVIILAALLVFSGLGYRKLKKKQSDC